MKMAAPYDSFLPLGLVSFGIYWCKVAVLLLQLVRACVCVCVCESARRARVCVYGGPALNHVHTKKEEKHGIYLPLDATTKPKKKNKGDADAQVRCNSKLVNAKQSLAFWFQINTWQTVI